MHQFVSAAFAAFLLSACSGTAGQTQQPRPQWQPVMDCAAYSNEQMRWNKGGSKILSGLTARRKAETAPCFVNKGRLL